jgi:hypothetical protein
MTTKSRREVLKYITAGGIAAVGATVGVQQLTAGDAAAGPGDDFDQIYKGRRIHTKLMVGRPVHGPVHPQLLIDNVELHVMVNADLTFTSVMNHYRTFPHLLDVARSAVDTLQGASLVALH